jgi:hypothetical protein
VSNAERGKRAFTASELFAIAYVLKVPVAHLFAPFADVEEVELSTGATISAHSANDLHLPKNPTLEAVQDMAVVVSDLIESHDRIRQHLSALNMQVDEVHNALAEGGE